MKLLKTQKRAFTLVELIIVITILVILATLAFINVWEYITSSRDANRVTQIKEIYNGLNIHALAAVNYPKPEWSIEISWVSFQWYIWEETIRKINISKLPIDPKDKTPYLYSINNTLTKAQLWIFLEKNNETFFSFQYPSKTYAETINYSDRFLYTLWENVWVFVTQENIPIQETYTGTIDLTSNTGTFIVQFNNNTKNGSITGNGQDLLTNISIIQNACVLDGTIINGGNIITAYKRKNIGYLESCESTLRKCTNSVLNGDSEYKYTTCTASSPLDCNSTDYSGYTIPTVPHSENKNIIKSVNYGTWSIDVSCNNWILSYGNETIICQNGYVLQWGSCIPDTCPGNAPNYSIANGTQSISGTWNHNIHGWVCTYICQAWYYNQTNSCTPASIWYIVPSEGQTTQNPCNTDTQYQDTTGQSTCKTVTTWYYTTPIWAVPHTGETLCEANHYCVNAIKTACPLWTNSPAGSTSASACTLNTYTVSGNFWANANGATINVCGTDVTAQTDGTFSTTRNYNAVCNNITATRPGYTCTTSTQWPASLTDHFTSVAGSCTPNIVFVYNQHTPSQCTWAGGEIMNVDGYFCKFNNFSCPSWWNKYKNWSTTQSMDASWRFCWSGCPSWEHTTFQNTATETCEVAIPDGDMEWCNRWAYYIDYYEATIKSIGCY